MNKQKVLALLSALCLTVAAVPIPEPAVQTAYAASAQAGELTADLLKYTVTDGQVTISGTTGSIPETFVIPAEIDGMPVMAIGDKAFQKQKTLVSLTLPSVLTSIGYAAFESCTELNAVTIPAGVTEIGISAFSNCNKLAEINLNEGLKKIGTYAFYCAAESELTLPSTLESIGVQAFMSNRNLTSVSRMRS